MNFGTLAETRGTARTVVKEDDILVLLLLFVEGEHPDVGCLFYTGETYPMSVTGKRKDG